MSESSEPAGKSTRSVRVRGHRALSVVPSPPPGGDRGPYAPIAIEWAFDNCGITTDDRLGEGALNVWGNSLPAHSLPTGEVLVHDIPFLFSGAGVAADNIRCGGQRLALASAATDWLHLLAASERRTEDVVQLHYADGACDPEWLRVSDFWPAQPRFGELLAFRSTGMHYPHHWQSNLDGQIWLTRIPVPRRTPLASVQLPDNPAIHVFAMTLQLAQEPSP
ncbi:MAG TPA: hypothetical protein VGM75_10905 [Pseudonocardiaceae bacterium]